MILDDLDSWPYSTFTMSVQIPTDRGYFWAENDLLEMARMAVEDIKKSSHRAYDYESYAIILLRECVPALSFEKALALVRFTLRNVGYR